MIQWRFGGGNTALATSSGTRLDDRLRIRGSGCALYGPYLDVPAGRLRVAVLIDGPAEGRAVIDITCDCGNRTLAQREVDLSQEGVRIVLESQLAAGVTGLEVRLVGDIEADIVGLELDLEPRQSDEPLKPDRPVGYESAKTFAKKIESGFWRDYMSGDAVLELGYKGYYGTTVPIVPQAIGVDVGYPGYDGVRLPFADGSFDSIYSSHTLEHIPDYLTALRDWYRLLRVGGYLIIVVPQQHLFEKRAIMPSLVNPDHHRFYTADSLLRELKEAFPENSFRVRHMRENDEGFNYAIPPRMAGYGCFEIELVVEKIAKPNWNSDDNTVRNYSAGEFLTETADRPTPWTMRVDFGRTDICVACGPYTRLRPARYVADFHFDPVTVEHMNGSVLRLDVAGDMVPLRTVDLTGAEGLEQLRTGVITIPFTIDADCYGEFRVFRAGVAVPGHADFKGVVLRYP